MIGFDVKPRAPDVGRRALGLGFEVSGGHGAKDFRPDLLAHDVELRFRV